MPQARERTVPTNCSGFYHCVSRCVRRPWLCGYDKVNDKSYDYRRKWVEDRLLALAEAYSVSIYAYAVMSNHLHVVVKVDAVDAQHWSDEEVARRWCQVFPGSDDPEAQRTTSNFGDSWVSRFSLPWVSRFSLPWVSRFSL